MRYFRELLEWLGLVSVVAVLITCSVLISFHVATPPRDVIHVMLGAFALLVIVASLTGLVIIADTLPRLSAPKFTKNLKERLKHRLK